jgi:hypothetical protein
MQCRISKSSRRKRQAWIGATRPSLILGGEKPKQKASIWHAPEIECDLRILIELDAIEEKRAV